MNPVSASRIRAFAGGMKLKFADDDSSHGVAMPTTSQSMRKLFDTGLAGHDKKKGNSWFVASLVDPTHSLGAEKI